MISEAPPPPPLSAQPSLIELLETLLEQAKTGEVVGIAAVCKCSDGQMRSHRDLYEQDRVEAIGSLHVLAQELIMLSPPIYNEIERIAHET